MSSLGCLFTLLVIAVVGYFAVGIGEHFFRFYEFQDAMRQELRFAGQSSDAVILRHLREMADSLDLPEEAGEVSLTRDAHHITLESRYTVHLEFPLTVRVKRFNPHVERSF